MPGCALYDFGDMVHHDQSTLEDDVSVEGSCPSSNNSPKVIFRCRFVPDQGRKILDFLRQAHHV
jgi:hypothetical protein